MVRPRNIGQQIPCLDSCQKFITEISNIKNVHVATHCMVMMLSSVVVA